MFSDACDLNVLISIIGTTNILAIPYIIYSLLYKARHSINTDNQNAIKSKACSSESSFVLLTFCSILDVITKKKFVDPTIYQGK
jgi:hypothetical protein